MQSKKCSHIRIRDDNYYNVDVEKFIKSLEAKHKVDFRCLPRWEELVQRMHVADTDCKRKIQGARLRKSLIIDKLYMQATRPSPFDLTAGLCRTASKWRKMKANLKKRKVPETPSISETDIPTLPLLEEQSTTIHYNTSVSSPSPHTATELQISPSRVDVDLQTDLPEPHLPAMIFTNNHKLISPLGSESSGMSYKSIVPSPEAPFEKVIEEWLCLKPTKSVVCIPKSIILSNNTLKKQFVQFTVINCADEYMHIRFKSIMDNSQFLKTKILPAIPKILYPGVPIVYRLVFTLRDQKEFNSGLFFKVGQDVCDNVPPEALCIPLVSAFSKMHSVLVSETINIPPVYPWHIKRNGKYSTATVKISVNDNTNYHLHIYKRLVDLSKESDISISLQASGLNTESAEEREMDADVEPKAIISMPNIENKSESINILESMNFIVESIIQVALDTFVFESTYVYLKPHEKVKIPVYFTKNERIGCHNSYYEFEFLEPETEKLIFTKTIKIFADVLPHPIKIHPEMILDMSNSPVTHGYIEDQFVITNTHKLYIATIKIKLTTKMKKMFHVYPMETTVPALQSVPFTVKFCSRDFLFDRPFEDLVHFTFKIIVIGHKSVFENVPPFFYEVVAPCAVEFKKVYNEKYFTEDHDSLVMETLD